MQSDYLNLLKQQIARIGINIDVILQDWPTFVGELIAFRDFDICYVALSGGGADPDFSGVYGENGSLNLFGYHTNMDWNETLGTGTNEWYIQQGTLIMPPDGEERVQHYWKWEQYLMDKILPCQPTFVPKNYVALWSNLEGYNFSEGIIQSWGKMGFTGTHTGQIDNTELVTTDVAWIRLNPLFQVDTTSKSISRAIMDPLFWYDADFRFWPHLAENYSIIDDESCIRVTLRKGIKWQEDPDGLFPDEYLDARDVYFTYYCRKHTSGDQGGLYFLDGISIVDNYTIDFYFDFDFDVPGRQLSASALPYLALLDILPEHYLNQTQLSNGIYPDITHPSWKTFANKCFGTGLFEFSSFTEGVETVLTIWEDCWKFDPTVDKSNMDFVNRFGDFTGGLTTWRIRIIPDIQTKFNEFEKGKSDIEGCTTYVDKRNQYLIDPTKEVQSDLIYTYGFFGYNMRPERSFIGNPNLLKDGSMTIGLAVRKAISYALDRNEINNVVHRGEYVISDYPINLKMGRWCNPNIIRYNHDLDLAKQYMDKVIDSLNLDIVTSILSLPIIMSILSILLTNIIIVTYKQRRNNIK